MSQNGAKLVFAHPVACPEEFDLVIPQKGDSRRVRIVWRSEMEAGVAFLASNAGTVVSIETARRIRALEGERTSLARRVATLSEPA